MYGIALGNIAGHLLIISGNVVHNRGGEVLKLVRIKPHKKEMILSVRSFILHVDYRHKDCTLQIAVKGKSGGMVKHVLRLVRKQLRMDFI